jgi:hypothetical protein
MADLSTVAQIYGNNGVEIQAARAPANNFIARVGQGIAGRTVIVSVVGSGGNVSQAELNGTIANLTTQSATGAGVSAADAFVVVGVAGTVGTGTMHLALQGTGTVGTDAADYFTGVTVAVVADFAGISG